jgi:hypothetical protein
VLESRLLHCVKDELVDKAACSVAAADVEAVASRDFLESTRQ